MPKKIANMLTNKLFVVIMVMFFLYITTYHLGFLDAVNWVQANDVYTYLIISKAAPAFPLEFIPFHFSQRWIPHYIVGLIAKDLYINLDLAYAFFNWLLIFVILILSHNIIMRNACDKWLGTLIFLILSLSTFTFRLYIFAPGLLADLVFVLGLTLAMKGCLDRRYELIVLGLLIATSGKQFSLLLLPGFSLYVYSSWIEKKSRNFTLALVIVLVTIVIIFYMLLTHTALKFALPNRLTPSVLFGFFSWLASDRYSSALLFEHILRIILPLFPFIIFITMVPSRPIKELMLLNTKESCALLLIALGPIAYAFFPGPEIQMGNQSRYIGLILFPVCILTLKIVTNIKFRLYLLDFIWLLAILLCLTYHHRYTFLQSVPITTLEAQMIGLLGFLTWLIFRKEVCIIQLKKHI